jgi:hypothetical protein
MGAGRGMISGGTLQRIQQRKWKYILGGGGAVARKPGNSYGYTRSTHRAST